MGSTLNSSESEFHWYGMRRSYGKEKMSKLDIGSVAGKFWAILGQIINRFRQVFEKGETEWELIEWFAFKAPDDLYRKLLSEIINFRQAEIDAEKAKKEAEAMEMAEADKLSWSRVYSIFPGQDLDLGQGDDKHGPWRLPTLGEMILASKTCTAVFCGDANDERWYKFSGDDSQVSFVRFHDLKISKSLNREKCFVCYVQDKKQVWERQKGEYLCPTCKKGTKELEALGKTRSVQGYRQCADCHADICSPGEAGLRE